MLWYVHLSGTPGMLLYRVAPLVASLALSWWVSRRLGPGALQPLAMLSLVAVSLGLRLVFEANFYSYYFMALAVALVLLEATAGSIRRTVVAWLAALGLWICRLAPVPFGVNTWGLYLQNDLIPLVIGVLAMLGVLVQLRRGGDRRNLGPWLALAAVDLVTLSAFRQPTERRSSQLVLAGGARRSGTPPRRAAFVREIPALWSDQIPGLRILAVTRKLSSGLVADEPADQDSRPSGPHVNPLPVP